MRIKKKDEYLRMLKKKILINPRYRQPPNLYNKIIYMCIVLRINNNNNNNYILKNIR